MGEGHNRDRREEGEGSSQGTCIKDPQTKTTTGVRGWGGGLMWEVGMGRAQKSNGGKMGTTVLEQQ